MHCQRKRKKETADYKTWVSNLENQIKTLKIQYENTLERISEKDKEILTYKENIICLQKDIEQLTEDIVNAKEELIERERQWNIQQRKLFKCIKVESEKKNNHNEK